MIPTPNSGIQNLFILLLTLVLLYALGATIATVCVVGYLQMGGPSWQALLYPSLFFVLSYVSVWFMRNRPMAVCGAIINLSIILTIRPFSINWIVCVIYSVLWLGAAQELSRARHA